MSPVRRPPPLPARKRPPHRVIIARGENIRTFTIRPWLIAGAVIVVAGVSLGYLGATGYLVFRDDLLATSIARQASMQHAYEDRIASLRADIDRLTSRQLLNQQEVEAEVQTLVTRQATITQRQDTIAGLSDAARAAGLTPLPVPNAGPALQPATIPAKPPLKTSALYLPAVIGPAEAKESNGSAAKPPLAAMSEVEAALDRMASVQVAYVQQLRAGVATRSDQISAILKGMGRDVPAAKPISASDVGGPFVPAPASAGTDPALFSATVAAANSELQRYAAVRKIAFSLPLTVPVPDPTITSGFGTRVDPFLGTPALHPGIDYAAREGQPVAATAPGTVIAADIGYNGGYGNMVDIDHGNGVVTRFGHLSEIDVKVGQVVAKGAIIGKAGSTGRATGPHVHYEVRINDTAIDPTRYISAGEKLLPLL